jgi:hypothetical protein
VTTELDSVDKRGPCLIQGTVKAFCPDNCQSLSRNSNMEPPEFQVRMLTTRLQRSVSLNYFICSLFNNAFSVT